MESPFRDNTPDDLLVIETLRWTYADGFIRLDKHLVRLETTCAKFAISVDKTDILSRLAAAVHGTVQRVRLTVGLDGEIKVTPAEIAENPAYWKVIVSEEKVNSENPWLTIKTNQRAFYDAARDDLPVGVDEIIFMNERGEITEGTITNVFADFGEGLVTPPLSCGVLPGIL
ncbi:MAG: aminotransferase class IV, partial [Candidatus Hydrogenedentes bacterium]|nr:aminotransferase class IV [Candidatus Hydrogenedentota bacterium]